MPTPRAFAQKRPDAPRPRVESIVGLVLSLCSSECLSKDGYCEPTRDILAKVIVVVTPLVRLGMYGVSIPYCVKPLKKCIRFPDMFHRLSPSLFHNLDSFFG